MNNTNTNILSKEIINEWGLSALSPEKQLDIVERLGKMIYQAVLVRCLDILSEKDQTELDLLLDDDKTTPQDVMLFLNSKIPTFEKLVLEERKNLREDLLIPTV